MLFRVIDVSRLEFVIIIGFFIHGLPYQDFLIFDLLVYSRRMISMWRVGDFITNTSSSKASYHAGIPYYSIDFYGFLSVSLALSCNPKEILLIVSLIQFASYYSDGSIY